MQVIPLDPVPAQLITVQLGSQVCQISIYQKAYGLFIDLSVNNSLIIGGVICQNLNRIVRSLYLGFSGDLVFLDNQGNDDPDYLGLGGRFTLMWVEPQELAGQG